MRLGDQLLPNRWAVAWGWLEGCEHVAASPLASPASPAALRTLLSLPFDHLQVAMAVNFFRAEVPAKEVALGTPSHAALPSSQRSSHYLPAGQLHAPGAFATS